MRGNLQLSTQIAMAIFVALILGYLFQEPSQETIILPSDMPTETSISTPVPSALPATPSVGETAVTPQPFVTLPGVWMARVIVYPDADPEIIKVTKLLSGRLTVSKPGDSHVRILDEEGIVIYKLTFQPSFSLFDVPADADDTTYFFIIPSLENANVLQVITPQGEATYEFPVDG